MSKRMVDYTGRRYNMLTAVKFVRRVRTGNQVRTLWLWSCDCGGKAEIIAHQVVQGRTKSCGCLIAHHKRGLDTIYYAIFIQGSAGYSDGDLTFEKFKELIKKPCFYCGKPPSNKQASRRINDDTVVYYSGLDRLDNSRGHDYDNVVPCCHKHNTAKGGFTYQQYIDDMKHQLQYLGVICQK